MKLTADFVLSRLIENYIEEMFNEKNVSFINRQKLWNFYSEKLSAAVDVGYSPTIEYYDKDLADSLKNSVGKFSAFKETSFKNDLENLLTTDGKLTPKSEFRKAAQKLSDDYNYRWIETERHQTIANANMAQKWKEFEQDVDLYPNIKLVSVHDARVRPEHKVLDGTIRPLNDPFWDSNTPPLDWGCRCDIEQTDEEPTEIKGGLQMKIEFKNNPGKTGEIFGGSAYEEKLNDTEKKEALKNVREWTNNTEERTERKKKDKILLSEFSEKVTRGNHLSIIGENLKNEVRISKSNVENVLNHIKDVDQKNIVRDLQSVIKKSEFTKSLPLDKDKDPKNYGKKVGRGVENYNYYKSDWEDYDIEINMEVLRNGYEQPYAITFKKKTP